MTLYSMPVLMRPRTLLLATVAAIGLPAMALAATLEVDAGSSACSDTKGTPFCKVQAAINAASAGDRIEIAAGSYIESLTIDRNLTLVGAGTSAVEGACDGKTNLLGGPGVTVGWGVVATLSNLTVKGGTASFGGGISNEGTLFVSDSEICNNLAFDEGAGIYDAGILTLQHVQVYGNAQASPGAAGGGLFVASNAWALVIDSTFSGNRVTQGGAIFIEPRGTLTMRRSMLSGNFADNTIAAAIRSARGAGISNSGLAVVDESTIGEGNAVLYSHGQGGGIYNEGHLILTRSVLYKNAIDREAPSAAGPGFGAGLYNAGVASVVSSTISGNLFNPTLLGFGAGITNIGTLSLSNATVTDNANGGTGTSGAGIYLDFGGKARVRNSIIAQQAVGDDCNSPITTNGHNIDSDGTCGLVSAASGGSDQPSVADPGLMPLGDYGGPTLSHNLTDASPAIDGGSPAGCRADLDGVGPAKFPLTTDQRGNTFVEVPDVGGDPSGCDVGAVEFNLISNAMLTRDLDHDHVPDGWTTANLADGDGLYCAPRATYAGGCAFGMRGDGSLVKQLAQAMDRAGNSGDRYSLILHDGAALVSGNPQVRVTFEDVAGGGIKQVYVLPLPTGSHGDQSHSLDITTASAYDRITVAIDAGSGGGLFVDNVSLEPRK